MQQQNSWRKADAVQLPGADNDFVLYTAHAELPNHSKPGELTRLSAAPENKRHGAAVCSSALLTRSVQRGVLTWGKLLAFSILEIHTLHTLTLAKHMDELLFLPYSNR